MSDHLSQFGRDVAKGLSSNPKHLESKYFYDEVGDDLFVRITRTPEYYLWRSEHEIFERHASEMIAAMRLNGEAFDLFELGAGDGTKTELLLRAMGQHTFTYKPIDISENALEVLEKRIRTDLPEIDIHGEQGEYFSVLDRFGGERRKVILFVGSSIGNMTDPQAHEFLLGLSEKMNEGDHLLLGLDLKKSTEIVLPAYDDADGLTRAFNLHLLERMNEELGADFDLNKFEHVAVYDEEKGWALSFLESLTEQTVRLDELDITVTFRENELIQTEISRKYDDEVLNRILEGTGLNMVASYEDSKNYFSDVILRKE